MPLRGFSYWPASDSPCSRMRSILFRRVAAYLLDVSVLFAVLAPFGYGVQRALGVSPVSAQGVYITLVFNFSLPAWMYFALADRSRDGATLGKRLLSLRTEAERGGPIGFGRAIARTAVKMIPWEVAHAAAFLFAPALGAFGVGNWIGIGVSYVLIFAYLAVAWRTKGRRSVHDFVAATTVRSSKWLEESAGKVGASVT